MAAHGHDAALLYRSNADSVEAAAQAVRAAGGKAKVIQARMTLVGLCTEGEPADRVDAYIRQFTRGIE